MSWWQLLGEIGGLAFIAYWVFKSILKITASVLWKHHSPTRQYYEDKLVADMKRLGRFGGDEMMIREAVKKSMQRVD